MLVIKTHPARIGSQDGVLEDRVMYDLINRRSAPRMTSKYKPLKFNIQVTMFMYRFFTAYKTNPGAYEDGNPTVEEGWFGIQDLSMDNKVVYDTMCKLLGTFSAIIMIWVGVFATERIHEQFSIQKPIGMIRVFAVGFRIVIELLVPAATMGKFVVMAYIIRVI